MTSDTEMPHHRAGRQQEEFIPMIAYIVYLFGLVTLVLHFSGFLARRNLQWVVLVAPVAIFTVNILDFMKIL